VSFGNFLFLLGVGLVVFGLVWRTKRRQAGITPSRRSFFTGPFGPVFIGVIIAIWSLYETGNL
jgi:hypothetical protein